MKKSDSIGILSNVNNESEYLTSLHRDLYMSISSNSIDLLKFNLIIITAFIALLGFLYRDLSQSIDGNSLLVLGVLVWLVSSFLSWSIYARCQSAITDQTSIFLNQPVPDIPQKPLSTHFNHHQLKVEILSRFATTCFFLSLLSIFLFSLSILSAPFGVNIIISIYVIGFISLSYALTMILIGFIKLWDERSLVKHGFQQHGFAPYKHTIRQIFFKIPWTKNPESYNTENGDRIFIVSGDLVVSSYLNLQIYSKPVKSQAAASGVLKGKSRSWDIVNAIMTKKKSFDIYVESDNKIIEYQNCSGGWNDLQTIMWDCEKVVKHDR